VVVVVAAAAWAIVDSRSTVDDVRADLARNERSTATSSRELTERVHALQVAIDASAARVAALTRKPDATAVAQETLRSVFTVDTTTDLGTAWVIRSASTGSDLITNYHVIGDDYEQGIRSVRLSRGDESFPATITDVDASADLAVIHSTQRFPSLHTSTDTPAIGETVFAVGSPLGLDGTVSAGIVSATDRVEDGRRLIQFSAPISPGNSGGPVVQSDGAVIGVSELKVVASGAEGLSFAIPTSTVCATFTVC
jgi:putative serine protease PepD